jgi:hypothetical protein
MIRSIWLNGLMGERHIYEIRGRASVLFSSLVDTYTY